MLAVALEGIDNILECGEKHFQTDDGENRFAVLMEYENCLDDLENLQTHPNHEIYEQTIKIIEKYFGKDEDDPLINALNNPTPNQNQDDNNNIPMGGQNSEQSYQKLFDL